MHKQDLTPLFIHSTWATDRILDTAAQLGQEVAAHPWSSGAVLRHPASPSLYVYVDLSPVEST